MSEQKLRDLDHALLIMATFLPFVYITALNYVFAPTPTELLLVVPFLFLAVALPLYVGYMRPVIEAVPNPNSERARGWTYLLFGAGLFTMTLAEVSVSGPSITLFSAITGYGFLFGFLGLTFFTYRFLVWLYKSIEYESIPIWDKASVVGAMIGTFGSTLFFQSLVLVFYGKAVNNAPFVYDQPTGVVVTIAFGLAFLAPLLALEVDCHHNISLVTTVFTKLKEKQSAKLPPNAKRIALGLIDFVLLTEAWAVIFFRAKHTWLVFVSLLLIVFGSVVADGNSIEGSSLMFLGDALLYMFLLLRTRTPKTLISNTVGS